MDNFIQLNESLDINKMNQSQQNFYSVNKINFSNNNINKHSSSSTRPSGPQPNLSQKIIIQNLANQVEV